MDFRKITAIIRVECLEAVEHAVLRQGAAGISVTYMKGCGELKDFFRNDLMVRHARVEIFTGAERCERIVKAVLETAHSGKNGDGIIAVLPVEQIYHIRTKQAADAGEL